VAEHAQFALSSNEKKHIDSILEKIEPEKTKSEFRVVSFDNFYKLFDKDEKALIERIITINPLEYGFTGKYFGIQDVPIDLVKIVDQKYHLKDKVKTIDIQYLPKQTYLAYQKLNESLYMEEKKKLLVLSGYRSSAYQAFVFLWYLKFYKFDLHKTVKRAAIPGYSEHGFPKQQAIDFITENGSPTEDNPEDFEKTVEYKWLEENAKKIGFYLTNPRNNKLGTMYEPWHWAHIVD
jgi:hypothetical protein